MNIWLSFLGLVLVSVTPAAYPQTSTSAPATTANAVESPNVATGLPANYLLGPNDQFSLIVDQLQDSFTDKTFRIDGQGDVTILDW